MKARSWLDSFKHPVRTALRVGREFNADDGPFIAAGIAFYAFFSLFPLVLISVAILSYLYPSGEAISDTIALASLFLPNDMVAFLDRHLHQVALESNAIGLTGMIVLLWSGRQLFRAMELALHRAWKLPVKRGWLAGNVLALTLVLLCTAVVLSVGGLSLLIARIKLSLSKLELPTILEQGWTLTDAYLLSNLHSWVIVPGAVALIFLLLYIFLPSCRVPIRMAVPGAVFSTIAWKLSSWVYLTYIVALGSRNPFYGTIWGIVGLQVWLYIEAVVFMLGAELVYVNLDSSDRAFLTRAAESGSKRSGKRG